MVEDHERNRDRFDLSLDGRQIASVVVGALVILGVVFVLGLNVGRQLSAREQVEGAGDTLAALDQPPVPPAEPMRAEEMTYDEELRRPSSAPIARAPAPAPAPAAVPAEPEQAAAPTATPTPSERTTATVNAATNAAPAPPAASTPRPAVAASVSRPPVPAASGAWTVQVGSAQDRAEAARLAKRFERWNARVETAELGSKGRWYRVRVGRHASREAAERFLRDLQRETGAKGYVTSAP